MGRWAPIRYMGFWDVPLIFVVPYKQELFLFDCPFDDVVEDYADSYKVYSSPPDFNLDAEPRDWTKLHLKATRYVGEVPIPRVRFDETTRRKIDTAVLDELTATIGRRSANS